MPPCFPAGIDIVAFFERCCGPVQRCSTRVTACAYGFVEFECLPSVEAALTVMVGRLFPELGVTPVPRLSSTIWGRWPREPLIRSVDRPVPHRGRQQLFGPPKSPGFPLYNTVLTFHSQRKAPFLQLEFHNRALFMLATVANLFCQHSLN